MRISLGVSSNMIRITRSTSSSRLSGTVLFAGQIVEAPEA